MSMEETKAPGEADERSSESPRRSWRHDSGDEPILQRAEESQDEAIRRARVAVGRAGVTSLSDAPTQAVPRPVAPTRPLPVSPDGREEPAPADDATTDLTISDQGQDSTVPPPPASSPVEPPQSETHAPEPLAPAPVIEPDSEAQPAPVARHPPKPAGPVPAALLLCILLGVLTASLPLTAALSGAVIVWLLDARGRSVLHQYEREQARGGFRRHGDGAKEAVRTPLYLLQALPITLGFCGLWLALFALADLLAVGLFSLPSTPLVLPVFGQTISIPLLAGKGISFSALLLGFVGAGTPAIVLFHGPRTRPIRLGLSVLWLAMRRGMCRIVSRDCQLVGPLEANHLVSSANFPEGYEAYGGDIGYGSPQDMHRRQHGGEMIGIIFLVLIVATIVVAAIHLASPVDWTPLVTGTDSM